VPTLHAFRPRRQTSGYTLLEVLLVVMIIGLAGIFVITVQRQALKNARLREAARVVQVLNQHARNTAILKQSHTQVRYDNVAGEVEVLLLNDQRARGEATQIALGIEVSGADTLKYDEDESASEREARLASTASSTITKRKLPKGVKVTEFESGTDILEQMDEVFRVDYWPTGYCQGHTVTLEDPLRSEEGIVRKVKISFEDITGDITLEKINE